MTTSYAPQNQIEHDLLKAGITWARKVLESSGRGFFLTQGIRDHVSRSFHYGEETDRAQALTALQIARRMEEQMTSTKQTFVSEARGAGATWQDIGDALNITKQAAQQKFGQTTRPKASKIVDVPLFMEGKK